MDTFYRLSRPRYALVMVGLVALLAACTTTTAPGSQIQPTQKLVITSEISGPTQESASPQPTSTDSPSQPEPTFTSAPAQAGTGPCDYLSKEEVAHVIGQKIVEARPDDQPPACRYMTEPDSSGNAGKVVVYVFTGPSASGGFETGKTLQDTNTQPVAGVGEDAYWSPSLDALNVLY